MLRSLGAPVAAVAGLFASAKPGLRCTDTTDLRRDFVLPGLKGKVAVVSAAAQGIGQGIALSLASQGATVVCVDLPQQQEGSRF
jgi:hypothetical protein